jgi:hypothetical protein
MHGFAANEVSVLDAVATLINLSENLGMTPDELSALLDLDLSLEHLLSYLTASAADRMN